MIRSSDYNTLNKGPNEQEQDAVIRTRLQY